MPLIQSLPGCPLDIIGDVHGQFEALQNLLHYLGYSHTGKHPQGRKLVFVGDLVDRGPDSPAVVNWAKQAINAGNAFMVLGNHEINLLAHEPKDGSGWFFDCRAGKDSRNYAPWQRQPENGKKALVQFFAEQPLVLQRPDLRIVHAAWLPESIAKLQNNATPLIQLIQEWDDELHCCIKHAPWYDDYLAEQHHHAHILENPAQHPPMLRATAAHDIYRSSRHPIRALTCGIEKIAREPFFAGGRWRFSIRNQWWDDYQDNAAVVIGHYWRHWHSSNQVPKHREGMFTVPANGWHGARKNVFCVDFSVGARWRDRKRGIAPTQSHYRLAALRFPEKTLMFDNGDSVKTVA